MAKSKSHQTLISNHFPIGLYHISYQPYSQNSKRKDKEQNDSVFGSLETTRMTKGGIFTEDEIEREIQILGEKGYKKIKKEPLSIDFPRICPNCHRNGSPSIVKWKKRYTLKEKRMSAEELIKLVTTRLIYHHSTSPETCHIGHINLSRNSIEIKLTNKLLKNKTLKQLFEYRKRFPKENQFVWK